MPAQSPVRARTPRLRVFSGARCWLGRQAYIQLVNWCSNQSFATIAKMRPAWMFARQGRHKNSVMASLRWTQISASVAAIVCLPVPIMLEPLILAILKATFLASNKMHSRRHAMSCIRWARLRNAISVSTVCRQVCSHLVSRRVLPGHVSLAT